MDKVLLVRLSSMGDLIHTFPAISDLAEARPDLSLSWLCEEAFADIAKLHPFVKNVIPMSGRKWRKSWWKSETRQQKHDLKAYLRTEHFDGVVDSQGLIKSALYAKQAKAPIYGLDKNSIREPIASRFYQHKYNVPWGQLAVERNRQLFSQVFQYPLKKQCTFGLKLDILENPFVEQNTQYAVLLHATSQERKLWAEQNWVVLADLLWREKQFISVLPWGNEAEKERAERIAAQREFIRVCPKLSLAKTSVLLNQAQCVAGVDTGLLHLANALNKPLCGIYTDTDPKATGVIPTSRSINLGDKGESPSIAEVFQSLELALSDHL